MRRVELFIGQSQSMIDLKKKKKNVKEPKGDDKGQYYHFDIKPKKLKDLFNRLSFMLIKHLNQQPMKFKGSEQIGI